jgi:PAS domain S-box-containing protein
VKQWFRTLRVPQKLAWVSTFFVLPNLLMLYFFITGLNANIQFARQEQQGLEYQRPLEDLLQWLPQHRRLSETVTRDGPLTETLAAKQAQIETALTALAAVDARLGVGLQFTDAGLAKRKREQCRPATLRTEWGELRARLAELTPEARAERHQHLLTIVRTMITHVGDMSNLILDPDLDSYYLMDATLLALPEAKHRLAEVIDFGRAALQHPDTFPQQRRQLAIYAALLRQSDLERIQGSLQTALNEDANFYGTSASLQKSLPPALQEFTVAFEASIDLTTRLAGAEQAEVSPEEFLAAGLAAREASFTLWQTAERELHVLLQRRIEHYEGRRTLSLLVAGCAALAAFGFVTFITRSITGPLRQQADALGEANAGLRSEVAERARAEQAMRESEARFRSVVDTALDAVVTMDAAGMIIGWNAQAETIFGWKAEEAIGRSLSQTIVSPQHREAHERGLKRFLASGQGPVLNQRIEITALHRDGREIDVELAITPLKMEGRMEFSAFLRDISARKQNELALAQAQKELLDASRQAGMAEIATGVLHNVGNVLNSVNVSANLLSDRVRKTPVADLERVVALLREQGANLGPFFTSDPRGPKVPDFLAQLSDKFTRQQESQLTEVAALQKNVEHIKDIVSMQQSYATVSGLTENFSAVELIEDALRMNAGSFQKHELELVRELPADLPRVCVDKHKVLQILVNLLRNAKHACDDAGRTDKRITVRAASDEGCVRITVTDTGVGIPAENLNRIFNHGFTTKKTGHGFGLHSAANAAQQMGGSLTVHSDGPGHGAAFTLELPLAPGPRLAAPAAEAVAGHRSP